MAKPVVLAVGVMPVVLAALAGCSSSGDTRVGSGMSCAAVSASRYLSSAPAAFVGVMLAGPDVNVGSGKALTSPARVRVVRWLKGSGPPIVTVTTGVTRNNAGVVENEDGIMPMAGQRWVIYATSERMPYQTSICSGSRQGTL